MHTAVFFDDMSFTDFTQSEAIALTDVPGRGKMPARRGIHGEKPIPAGIVRFFALNLDEDQKLFNDDLMKKVQIAERLHQVDIGSIDLRKKLNA